MGGQRLPAPAGLSVFLGQESAVAMMERHWGVFGIAVA